MKLIIPGEPFGKQRPKFSSRGYGATAITPEKTVNYETFVKYLYAEKYKQMIFSPDEPLVMIIKAYKTPPTSGSKIDRNLMLSGFSLPTKKPDWDNIGKIIADALNGRAYPDDKQIISAATLKYYDENPRVEVEIYSLFNDIKDIKNMIKTHSPELEQKKIELKNRTENIQKAISLLPENSFNRNLLQSELIVVQKQLECLKNVTNNKTKNKK